MSGIKATTKRLIIVKKRSNGTNVIPSETSNCSELSGSSIIEYNPNYESVKVEDTYPSESVLIGNLSTPAQVSDLSELLREELRVVCDKIVKITGWNALRDWCEEILASFCLDYANSVVNMNYTNHTYQESTVVEECVDDSQYLNVNDTQRQNIPFSQVQECTDYISDQNCSAVAYDVANDSADMRTVTLGTCEVNSQEGFVVDNTSSDIVVKPRVKKQKKAVRAATQVRDYVNPEDNSVIDMADVIVLQYGEDIETEDVDILDDQDDHFVEDSKINVITSFYVDDTNGQMSDDLDPEDTNISNICEQVLRYHLPQSARPSNATNPERPFYCLECDKNYKRMADLHLHQKTHTGELQTVCSVCGKTFSRLESLKRHLAIHSEQKFGCEQCDKKFASKEGRIRHVKNTHKIEESTFICTQCAKKCCSGYELRKHETWCRGDRPYGCTHCGKRFAAAGNLRTHEMIHTGERPYGCTQCDRRFVSSSYVKVHVRQVHTNERPFKCLKCDKAFAVPQVLKLHQLVHTGVRPYTCTQCGKKLASRSAFKGHQAMHLRAASGAVTTHPRRGLKRSTREIDRLNL